jgi:hypothetical protein
MPMTRKGKIIFAGLITTLDYKEFSSYLPGREKVMINRIPGIKTRNKPLMYHRSRKKKLLTPDE